MAGFYDPSPFFLRPYHNLPCPVLAAGRFRHFASRVVQHTIFRAEVFDALAPNNAALVFRKTGWVATECGIAVKMIVFDLRQLHLSSLSPIFTLRLCATALRRAHVWGDILSWRGTSGPRTTCPGEHPLLGPHVRGDSWSGVTGDPPTLYCLILLQILPHGLGNSRESLLFLVASL